MKLYLKFSDIPELSALPKSQQQEVWSSTAGRRLRDPVMLGAILVLAALGGFGGYAGSQLIGGSVGVAIGAGVGGGLAGFAGALVGMARSRPFLAEEIRRRPGLAQYTHGVAGRG